jgi:hypothetical protein
VRRLRYKDGREMALRGDDFIGAAYDPNDKLWLLKGEAKSNKTLDKTTITNARTAPPLDSESPIQVGCELGPTNRYVADPPC